MMTVCLAAVLSVIRLPADRRDNELIGLGAPWNTGAMRTADHVALAGGVDQQVFTDSPCRVRD